MIIEAIVLAGGLGTRLRSAVPDLPKCMAPVAGKPFLSYLVEYLVHHGIGSFIFALGYKHEIIEEHLDKLFSDLQTRNHVKLNYQFSVEGEPLGTGGAIWKACQLSTSENIFVLNGDTFFAVEMKRLADLHEKKQADCTLSLKPLQHFDRYGVIVTAHDDRVISFREKARYETGNINGGVYALNRSRFIEEDLPERFSFETDYLEKYTHRKIYGMKEDKYFIDIGIPSDYLRAQKELPKNI